MISDGSLEAVKWLAIALMILDHTNKYLLGGSVQVLFAAGRLAFPLFAFVLAYNLARPGALNRGAYLRSAKRLTIGCLVATVPFAALGGLVAGWWPINILGAFIVSVGVMHLLDRGGVLRVLLAALLFVAGGLVVEYWWPGIAMTIAAWAYFRRPSTGALIAWIASTAALGLGPWMVAKTPMVLSSWALATFAVIVLAARVPARLPRTPWAIYIYPAHLGALWVIRQMTS